MNGLLFARSALHITNIGVAAWLIVRAATGAGRVPAGRRQAGESRREPVLGQDARDQG